MAKIGLYGVLPANVRYDKNLTDKAKLLYAEITASLDYEGECEELTDYYSRLLDVSTQSVSKHIRALAGAGYIKRDKLNDGRVILSIPKKVVTISEEKRKAPNATDVAIEVARTWGKLFNDILPKGFRRTDDLTVTVSERLKKFSKEDIMSGIKNRHDFVRNSEWHNKDENLHHMASIHHAIGTDENLSKCLNLVVVDRGVDYRKHTRRFETNEDSKEALE